MNFDATSLYPSAMWDEKSLYPKIETGYAFTPNLNDQIVAKSNNQTLAQGSAILKISYCKSSDLMFQHLPIKEKVKKLR